LLTRPKLLSNSSGSKIKIKKEKTTMKNTFAICNALAGAALLLTSVAARAQSKIDSIVGDLGTPLILSTIPSNGDVNPYGVAFVPAGFPTGGALKPGDILVSNYNNSQNLQGTGTTIVHFRNGVQTVFFQGQPGLGLSTGLAVLKSGFVLVANFPTADGTSATAQPGSLMALDKNGNVFWSYSNTNIVNGPWDFTVNDQGSLVQVFVSDVLTGKITRIDLSVAPGSIAVNKTLTISSGYGHRPDPAALEVGPTGLAYDAVRDVLYVSASFENAIYAVANAGHILADGGVGYRIFQDSLHLHGALAMILAPNGHLIVSNSDVVNGNPAQASELVEFTVYGKFIAQYSVDPNQGGAFGLNATVLANGDTVFAAVDDNTSSLKVWTLAPGH
jgi:hypothetical protein